MNDDDIKKIEARGYAKGYQAGRRRKQADIRSERHAREEKAFRDRAFLAALPAFISAHGWEMDGEKVTNLDQRVELAWRAARRAVLTRREQA